MAIRENPHFPMGDDDADSIIAHISEALLSCIIFPILFWIEKCRV